MLNVALIIPVFQPGDRLEKLIRELAQEFRSLVVVDDGSTENTDRFDFLAEIANAKLLRHDRNRGKGAALKTAFAEILRAPDAVEAVVTADGDGQHLMKDILAVADATLANPDAITFGVRQFAGRVPFRSRLGNLWTELEFFLLTRCRIPDTQTGLRGIPFGLLPAIAALPGERYEYESRMLVAATRLKAKPVLIPIETVYLDGNSSSHYRPLRDTLITQRALWSAASSSN